MKNEEIIEHVKAKHEKIKSYIEKGIDNGYNVVLVHLTGPGAFQKPNYLGVSPSFYNAKRYKDKILAEFDANPGKYVYGILLGKQPGGFYLVCIEIDFDNSECNKKARARLEETLKKYGIHYHLETTISGSYHIFIKLDGLSKTIQNINKLSFTDECMKSKDGKPVNGIRVLGTSGNSTMTFNNGIVYN